MDRGRCVDVRLFIFLFNWGDARDQAARRQGRWKVEWQIVIGCLPATKPVKVRRVGPRLCVKLLLEMEEKEELEADAKWMLYGLFVFFALSYILNLEKKLWAAAFKAMFDSFDWNHKFRLKFWRLAAVLASQMEFLLISLFSNSISSPI